jgi:hypothetical protein
MDEGLLDDESPALPAAAAKAASTPKAAAAADAAKAGSKPQEEDAAAATTTQGGTPESSKVNTVLCNTNGSSSSLRTCMSVAGASNLWQFTQLQLSSWAKLQKQHISDLTRLPNSGVCYPPHEYMPAQRRARAAC